MTEPRPAKGSKVALVAITGSGNFMAAMKMLDEAKRDREAQQSVRIEVREVKFHPAGWDAVIKVSGNDIPAPDLWLAEGVVTEVV
jgi:hypothetical protein